MTIIPEGTKVIVLDNGELYTKDMQLQIETLLTEKIGVRCVFAPAAFPESDGSRMQNGLENIRNEIRDFRYEYSGNRTRYSADDRTLNGHTLLKSLFCLLFGFLLGSILSILI